MVNKMNAKFSNVLFSDDIIFLNAVYENYANNVITENQALYILDMVETVCDNISDTREYYMECGEFDGFPSVPVPITGAKIPDISVVEDAVFTDVTVNEHRLSMEPEWMSESGTVVDKLNEVYFGLQNEIRNINVNGFYENTRYLWITEEPTMENSGFRLVEMLPLYCEYYSLANDVPLEDISIIQGFLEDVYQEFNVATMSPIVPLTGAADEEADDDEKEEDGMGEDDEEHENEELLSKFENAEQYTEYVREYFLESGITSFYEAEVPRNYIPFDTEAKKLWDKAKDAIEGYGDQTKFSGSLNVKKNKYNFKCKPDANEDAVNNAINSCGYTANRENNKIINWSKKVNNMNLEVSYDGPESGITISYELDAKESVDSYNEASAYNNFEIGNDAGIYTEASSRRPVPSTTTLYHGSPVQNMKTIRPHKSQSYPRLGNVVFASDVKEFATCFCAKWNSDNATLYDDPNNPHNVRLVVTDRSVLASLDKPCSLYEIENDGSFETIPKHDNEMTTPNIIKVRSETKYNSFIDAALKNRVPLEIEPIPITNVSGYTSDAGVYNALVNVKGYNKNMRGRSEMLVIKDNEYLFAQIKKDGSIKLPGGSWDRDEDHKLTAIRETQEEAGINVNNVTYHSNYITLHDKPHDWVMANIPKDFWWYAYFTEIYAGDYAGKFSGKVADIDKDELCQKGQFYKITDIFDKLNVEHKIAVAAHLIGHTNCSRMVSTTESVPITDEEHAILESVLDAVEFDYTDAVARLQSAEDNLIELSRSGRNIYVGEGLELYKSYETEYAEAVKEFEEVLDMGNHIPSELPKFKIYEASSEEIRNNPKIDDGIKDILVKLNKLGYKTKYSCTGHSPTRLARDGKKDGIYHGKLYTTARINFDKVYNFATMPDNWYQSNDGDITSIYVKPCNYDKKDGSVDTAFDNWKKRYMNALNTWVDELPPADKTDEIKESSDFDTKLAELERQFLESCIHS